MQIGLLAGSHGIRSANVAVLTAAARTIEVAGHGMSWVSGLETVPFFRADLVDEPPTTVSDFRRQLHGVDAVLIAAPEYAAGLAGSTKNALDWLVGDSTLDRKIVGAASAGTTGGNFAIEQLVRTISWQGGYVVSVLSVAAPRTKSSEGGAFTDDATLHEIAQWVDAVLAAVDGSGADRLALLTEVVTQFGIDPERFGTIA
ncbi:MAG: NADPH-dependent FMN reductase [Iamia sp.]